jgi:hypothetical protein
MTRTRLSRVLRAAGLALVPAVLLLCYAGRADASCGDYVKVIGPDGKAQLPANHDPMPTERPCQGPNCTGGPKAPAPVPPAPTSQLSDGKALVTEATSPADADSATRPTSDADGAPARQPDSIFHPPRAS